MRYNLHTQLRDRILVLDGGMGTLVQGHGLTEADYRGTRFADHPTELKGCNDVLAITRPDVIGGIHEAYLQAGADIISTDSFNATRISLADYGLQEYAREMNCAAAALARGLADKYTLLNPNKPRFVAGSMGPTGKSASMSPDVADPGARAVTFDELQEAYREQARGLVDGGVDVLLVETIFDTLNAKAALRAIESLSDELQRPIPIMLSATITDASGRILSGQTLEAFLASVWHARGLLSVGLNCAFGAEQLRPYVGQLGRNTPLYISSHPNAGLPNVMGGYDETPQTMAAHVERYLQEGLVNIVGGCCGTTPAHIALIASMATQYEPRKVSVSQHITTLSGLEALAIAPERNFVNVGERTNVAGSAKFARLIREDKMEEALAVAREQVEAGAQVIDVCMDDGMIDGPQAMTRFLNLVAAEPQIARVPVMVDSSRWEVLEVGLKCTQGKSVVNSISLKEGEQEFLRRASLIRSYGAAAVVMLFDERGQADTFERKVEVAQRAYRLLTGSGFPPEDIIFDPNVLAVATGIEEHNGYGVAFIEAVRWIKTNLPHAKVSGGISNLSFSYRGNNAVREAMHAAFLYHAIAAGLDMGIVNPSATPAYSDIEPELLGLAEDVVLNRRADAAERLTAFAQQLQGNQTVVVASKPTWRDEPVGERIAYAMLKGVADHVAQDALEAYSMLKDPLKVIDTMLMPAMERVGELFGQGKMFLPQVVKSARVMKTAVGALEPYIKEGAASSASKGKVLLATVKGDVHDIGKNIVSVVMACNGFRIDDLGVMVEADRIVDTAMEWSAEAIGLSGLITPSLEEMIRVAKLMEQRGLDIPLIIGGATTSPLHTAVKIAPCYSGPVVHSRDASDGVRVLSQLLSAEREAFIAAVRKEQTRLCEQYEASQATRALLPLDEARARKYIKRSRITPATTGRMLLCDMPIAEVIPRIDWRFFSDAWEVKNDTPEASKLRADAEAMLADIPLKLSAVVGIYPAFQRGDDIVVQDERGRKVLLPMLRNQQADRHPNLCLSDYLLPEEDHIALFALSAGEGLDEVMAKYRAENDDYHAIMAKLLADRLTEALAEVVHEKLRREWWGFEGGLRCALGYPACPDHSLKREIFDILHVEQDTAMRLTENYMIAPGEALCGMILTDPQAKFFSVGRIAADQLADYAARRSMSIDRLNQLIPDNL